MKNNEKNQVASEEGIKVDDVSFDENGAVVGLADDVLDAMAGGLMSEDAVDTNKGCGNSANVSC